MQLSTVQSISSEQPVSLNETLPLKESSFQFQPSPYTNTNPLKRKRIDRPVYKDRLFVSDEINRGKIVEKLEKLQRMFPDLKEFILKKGRDLTPEKYRSIAVCITNLGKNKANILESPKAKKRLFDDTKESIYIFKIKDICESNLRLSKYVGKVGNRDKPSSKGRSVALRTNEHLFNGSNSYFDQLAGSMINSCDPENSGDNIQIGIISDDLIGELIEIGLKIEQIEFVVMAAQVLKRDTKLRLGEENVSIIDIVNTKMPSIGDEFFDSSEPENKPKSFEELIF